VLARLLLAVSFRFAAFRAAALLVIALPMPAPASRAITMAAATAARTGHLRCRRAGLLPESGCGGTWTHVESGDGLAG
jgi:hypothetical protein